MKRVPQLDSVRGLAVMVVLLHNTDKLEYTGFLARNGWMGVDLFFVLSGLLITGILLDKKQKGGYFRNFYARRCLRIWPLYYCALLFMFVVVPALRPSEAHRIFEPRSMPWWAYFVYLQNFLVPAATGATGLLGVTWSLAVEEQFYAVWPIIVRYFSEAQLRNLAIVLICGSPILRFFLVRRGFNVYPNTFCRLDGLMAGVLLALAFRSKTFSPEAYVRPAWMALLIGSLLALITAHRVEWAVYSFTALSSASFVYLALCSKQKWLQAMMGNRFLIYTGTISYGIYLLEKIPIDAAQSLHLDEHPILVLLVGAVSSFLLATISWNVLEKPLLRLKRFFEWKPVVPVQQDQFLAPAS
jgi:peptidoglycan/LPS O-acetylase OafA/YrhL